MDDARACARLACALLGAYVSLVALRQRLGGSSPLEAHAGQGNPDWLGLLLALTLPLTIELVLLARGAGRAVAVAATVAQLVGLLLVDKGGVLRSHQTVHTPQGDGETTSGTFSPTLGQSIALARVPNGVAPGDIVQVSIRDRPLNARVVKLPFARNGKALVQA